MSAVPSNTIQAAEITTINANTRVDYVLKYNQQPVVVMAEYGGSYEAVKSEYLASLSEHVNAAYISASVKLTNIQIRCRLIEQLYQGALFDPEKPLPQTLGRLLDTKESISLIFDQGQYLSEQMLIELCQLASLAKKRSISLAIVIFSTQDIASLLVRDKTLFDKRLTIINASSGQIIPVSSRQLKRYQQSDKAVWTKFVLMSICLLVVASVIGYFAYLASSENTKVKKLTEQPTKMVLEASNDEHVSAKNSLSTPSKTNPLASNKEIYAALTQQTILPLEQSDTVSENRQQTTSKQFVQINPEVSSKPKSATKLAQNEQTQMTAHKGKAQQQTQAITTTNAKALEIKLPWQAEKGVVIQLAGFTQKAEMKAFIEAHPIEQYFHYRKQVNNKPYWVLISPVYDTRAQAKQAITQLPKIYQQQGPWIKSVTAIKQERITDLAE